MDIQDQDQAKTSLPSGHKEICGTTEGNTNLIDSGVVSDEDQQKTPSPKIVDKRSTKGIGGVRSIRSEEDLYSDAVTEFSDAGISPGVEDRFVDSNKTLDRDVFLSFKNNEYADTTELLGGPVGHSKAEANSKVNETLDTHTKATEKIEESEVTAVRCSPEAETKLAETDEKLLDHLIKDEAVKSTPGQSDVSPPHKAESIDLVEGNGHGKEAVHVLSVPSDIPVEDQSEALLEDFKDHKAIFSNVPVALGSNGDNDTTDEIRSSPDTFEVETVGDKTQETDTSEIGECLVESVKTEHDEVGFSEEAKVAESNGSLTNKTAPESVEKLIEDKGSSATGLCEEDDIDEQERSTGKISDLGLREKLKAEATEGNNEETKHEKLESDHEHAAKVVKEPEIDHSVSVFTEKEDLGAHIFDNYSKEHAQETIEEPEIDHRGSVLPEEEDLLGRPNFEGDSQEHTQVVKEPKIDHSDSVLTKKEDLRAPNSENCSTENTQELVKEPEIDYSGSVLIEKEDLGGANLEDSSKEHTQEAVKEPEIARGDLALSKKEDLGAPNLADHSEEHNQEVIREPKIGHNGSVLTKKEELSACNLEDFSKEHIQEVVKEPKIDNGSQAAQEVVDTDSKDSGDVNVSEKTSEKIILKEAEPSPNDLERPQKRNEDKNASGVVPEPMAGERNDDLTTNQDSRVDVSADSSSHNSVEGNWGSVSVLSTASIDAETLHSVDKSKVNSEKSIAVDPLSAKSDVFDAPSSTDLEGKVAEQKATAASSETKAVQNSQQQPTAEASQAGGFPALANVSNESEGRKRNEEVIAKVTNWSTGKHSAPLKNLLGEAKSPNPKLSTVIQKDEAVEESNGNVAVTEKSALPSEAPVANQDISPPKYIGDGKKVKRRASWMPFVCCSSVNVGN